jgi:hypothetical protein
MFCRKMGKGDGPAQELQYVIAHLDSGGGGFSENKMEQGRTLEKASAIATSVRCAL